MLRPHLSLHRSSRSPCTSRLTFPLLRLGCSHCLRQEYKGARPNPQCRQVRETNKEDMLKKQLKGKIVVQGQETQFIRSNEPFAYLRLLVRVPLTMNRNWKHQHIHLTENFTRKLKGLSASYTLSRQTHDVIYNAIIPGLAYSFPVTPCTTIESNFWDQVIDDCSCACQKPQATSVFP